MVAPILIIGFFGGRLWDICEHSPQMEVTSNIRSQSIRQSPRHPGTPSKTQHGGSPAVGPCSNKNPKYLWGGGEWTSNGESSPRSLPKSPGSSPKPGKPGTFMRPANPGLALPHSCRWEHHSSKWKRGSVQSTSMTSACFHSRPKRTSSLRCDTAPFQQTGETWGKSCKEDFEGDTFKTCLELY